MDDLLTKYEVASRLRLAPETVRQMSARHPGFPKPIKMGSALNSPARWRATDIDAWLAARVATSIAK